MHVLLCLPDSKCFVLDILKQYFSKNYKKDLMFFAIKYIKFTIFRDERSKIAHLASCEISITNDHYQIHSSNF